MSQAVRRGALSVVLTLVCVGSAHAAGPQPSSAGTTATSADGTAAPASLAVTAAPASAQVGQPVQLAVTNAPATATGFLWQIPGSALSTVSTGSQPRLLTRFTAAGAYPVTVHATIDGRSVSGTLKVSVSPPAPAAASAPAPASAPAASASVTASTTTATTTSATTSRDAVRAVAHAAADPGVNIIDFAFSPSTTTIHVGDTITWTNTGKQPHTATATNHSFDTGILTNGKSASHTFSQAGTFAYICTVHPYMKATVVVLGSSSSGSSSSPNSSNGSASTASTASGSPSPSSSTGTGSPSTGTASSTGSTGSSANLPYTGMNVWVAVLIGLGMIGGGLALRRRAIGAR